MNKSLTYLLLVTILISSCTKENIPPQSYGSYNELETGWLVPIDQLLISQLPADRIHSIDAPFFLTMNNVNLNSNETVYVYRYGDTIKVYPERILGGHEIVNDRIGNHHFAITYCPLTGSAVAWNRKINGEVTEFGVSGHLFNENLIPYDRNSQSYWSQMRLESIKGVHGGDRLKSGLLLSTTAGTISNSFPNALVLIDTAGNCNDSICIPLKQGDNEGEPGGNTVVLPGGDFFGIVNSGIINGGNGALLLNYESFNDGITVYNTYFRNSKIIIVGSKALQFIVAFIDKTGDPKNQFTPVQNALPVIMKDNIGNYYDITGLIVSGPSEGDRLSSPDSYSAHSFAWELFFGSNIELFENK